MTATGSGFRTIAPLPSLLTLLRAVPMEKETGLSSSSEWAAASDGTWAGSGAGTDSSSGLTRSSLFFSAAVNMKWIHHFKKKINSKY